MGTQEIIKSKKSNAYEKNLLVIVNSKRTRKRNRNGKKKV